MGRAQPASLHTLEMSTMAQIYPGISEEKESRRPGGRSIPVRNNIG